MDISKNQYRSTGGESVGCLVMIAPSILRCTVVTSITTMGPKSLWVGIGNFATPRFHEVQYYTYSHHSIKRPVRWAESAVQNQYCQTGISTGLIIELLEYRLKLRPCAKKSTFFSLKKQIVKLSKVQKCKSPLENFHMVSTLENIS